MNNQKIELVWVDEKKIPDGAMFLGYSKLDGWGLAKKRRMFPHQISWMYKRVDGSKFVEDIIVYVLLDDLIKTLNYSEDTPDDR